MRVLSFVFAVLCSASFVSSDPDPDDIHFHLLPHSTFSEQAVQHEHEHEPKHKPEHEPEHPVQTQTQTQSQSQSQTQKGVKTGSGYALAQKQTSLAKKIGSGQMQTYSGQKTRTGNAQKQREVEKCKFSSDCPRRSLVENRV